MGAPLHPREGEEGAVVRLQMEGVELQVAMDPVEGAGHSRKEVRKMLAINTIKYQYSCVCDIDDPLPVPVGVVLVRRVGVSLVMGVVTYVVPGGVPWWRSWTRSPRELWRDFVGAGRLSCREQTAEGTRGQQK